MADRPPISFFVIGAQKAGSTFLQDMLATHPRIFIPRPELPDFEDPDYGATGLAGLGAHYPPEVHDRVLGLKRPNYLAAPEVPPRVAAAYPDARIVVVVRDPIKRLVSAWWHYVRYGAVPLLPPGEGIRRLLAGELRSAHPRADELLDFGRYATHLTRWLESFRRDAIEIVVFEELVADPVARAAPLATRLTGSPGPLTEPVLRMTGISNPVRLRYWQLTHPLAYRTSADGRRFTTRWRPLERALHAVDTVALSRLFRSRGPSDLDAEVVAELRAFYGPEVAGTEAIVGRPIPAWESP